MPETRNTLDPEAIERNRELGKGWTFNAPPPVDYEGRLLVVATVRLGDHAHVRVDTARQHPNPDGRDPTVHRGHAGRLVMQWEDWLAWRAQLDADGLTWVVEVENPTQGQLDYQLGHTDAWAPGETRL